MRINVLGAGPAGLYFAILMKKADPRHEISVFERNAPGATFGFGVVFSEGSLDQLEDADYESYITITESFAKWNPLDVRFRGTTTRVRGNVFSGVERKELLRILQARAVDLGVEQTFDCEVESLDPYLEADVLVGADGVNSLVRSTFAADFAPDVQAHPAKYAWFAADFALPVFTYIFKPTRWGLFQAHCYPYNEQRSTMVVLISEDTWRRASLDEMDEDASLAFTRAVFQDELGEGRGMISNRSLWINFPWIRCRSWHSGNAVLVGDAAHTAHFSIGSGTKLALEDSIALAKAFTRWRDNVPAALVEYEMERQPVVERFQEASRVSADYFSSIDRYLEFDPIQFTYQLMTRTPRITHYNLALRDPSYVRHVETWFHAHAEGRHPNGMLASPPPAFVPLRLRDVTVPNRVAVAPVEHWDRELGTGAGLVITPTIAVSEQGRFTPETPLARDLPKAPGNVLVMPSIGHAGRRGSMRPRRFGVDLPLPAGESWELVSASPLAFAPWAPVPAELDAEGMAAVVADFAEAARRSRERGYRLLELDFSRGGLVASFLSPLSNRRTDDFGGTIEQRLCFPLRVLQAVREEWPADLPLAVACSVSDQVPGGLAMADAFEVARCLSAAGTDVIRVFAGQSSPEWRPDYSPMYGAALADRVRNECRIPTIAFGRITTMDEVNTVIAAGRADLCVMTR